MNTEMRSGETESQAPDAQPEVQESPEPKSRALRRFFYWVVVAAVLTIGAVAVIHVASRLDAGHDVETNYYKAPIEINGEKYVVEINENDRGLGFRRIVQLNIDGVTFHGITGHDYNGDGRWDRVFYCGAHPMLSSSDSSLGCNSVVRTDGGWGRGEWEFEPCLADQGKIKGFTPEAIAFAIRRLDLAMSEVHQKKYLVEHWLWDRGRKDIVRVFPPTSNT